MQQAGEINVKQLTYAAYNSIAQYIMQYNIPYKTVMITT